jgi:hypothetical protein
MCWRAALAAANLDEDAGANRWVKSVAYNRLDRSEKSAVSYFLGMAQAKITCEMLLGVPHMVHLDAVLALLGQTTNVSRPDFVGFDLATGNYTIAVEAKGRTHSWSADLTARAKTQATLIPAIVGTTSNVRVASIAYFADDCWQAYLEDPDGPYDEMADLLSAALLLVVYYRPLVLALLTVGGPEDESSTDSTVVRRLPGIDLYLGLPRVIIEIIGALPLAGPIAKSEAEAAGADIRGSLLQPFASLVAGPGSDSWFSRGTVEASNPASCIGSDGVQVLLGPSWSPAQ